MKPRPQKRQTGGSESILAQCCEAVDRSIPVLRTVFILAGLALAAVRGGRLADYLFATGLLLHFSISFEHWWKTKRTR